MNWVKNDLQWLVKMIASRRRMKLSLIFSWGDCDGDVNVMQCHVYWDSSTLSRSFSLSLSSNNIPKIVPTSSNVNMIVMCIIIMHRMHFVGGQLTNYKRLFSLWEIFFIHQVSKSRFVWVSKKVLCDLSWYEMYMRGELRTKDVL